MIKKAMTLNRMMKSLPVPVKGPPPLPFAHLSEVRWFDAIARGGSLVPTRCDVFKKRLLYFSYGGVHYRTNNKQSENAVELPIAFLFEPTVLDAIERYYPFDTGAIAKLNLGRWTKVLQPIYKRRFKVPGGDFDVPAKMVRYLYGDNQSYLRGEVDSRCMGQPDPLPMLCQFLSADLSSLGVDHRQRMIEAQTTKPLSLAKGLVWIAFPKCKTKDYTALLTQIYQHTKPSMPFFYDYDYYKNFNPSSIAEHLQGEARYFIERYVAIP